MKRIKFSYISIILFVIFIETLLLITLNYYKNSNIETIEKQYVQRLSTQFNTVLNFYSTTSTILIDEILSRKEVQTLLENINTNDLTLQQQIRDDLYTILKPTYERLTKFGFRQLHFHDINGNSFLRFHSVENYGDNLFKDRATILKANQTKQSQFGFEEGKIVNGFRNVFPIFIDDEFIGTVELSNAFETFISELHKYFPFEYKLLIAKEYVNSKVFLELVDEYYTTSNVSDLFYEEKENSLTITNNFVSSNNIAMINMKLKKEINSQLQSKQPFAKSIEVLNQHYIITFLPIYDFDGTINTYLLSYTQNNALANEHNKYLILIFSSNIILIVLILIFVVKHFSEQKDLFMYKAYTDPLTKLLNRTRFNYDFNKIVDNYDNINHSLIMFDIDHFKQINDTYGHDVGDMILTEFAEVVRHTLRDNDKIYRWGGEEFAILINDTSKEHIQTIAEKLRYAISEHNFKIVGLVTSSFGVAIASDGDTKDTLLKRADKNLYKAKQNGRNCVVMD